MFAIFQMYKTQTNNNSKLFIFGILDVQFYGVYDSREYLSCFVQFFKSFYCLIYGYYVGTYIGSQCFGNKEWFKKIK